MCEYVEKSKLTIPKRTFQRWVSRVREELKEEYGLTFQVTPIGSGKRNMVVKKCNSGDFDLDYQITISKFGSVKVNDVKFIKNIFRNAFDDNKPGGFSCCEDSTQALTTFNKSSKYGFDIIITIIDFVGDYWILYNNKNSNNANNKDYEWQKRRALTKYKENLDKMEGPEMWNELRDIYLDKKHKYSFITDKNDQRYKHSYQILHEAVNEVLSNYGIQISK